MVKRKEDVGLTSPEKKKKSYDRSHDGTKNYVVYKDIQALKYEPEWKMEKNFNGKSTVMYFKFDLRTVDNPALFHAAVYAQEYTHNRLIALYVLCIKELKIHEYADCKIGLIHDTLLGLKRDLKEKYGIPLIVVVEEEPTLVPHAVKEFCKQVNAEALFHNQMYEHDESKRDAIMEDLCTSNYVNVSSYEDQCVVPVKTLKSASDKDYVIFTPYKKAWLKVIEEDPKKYLSVFNFNSLKYRNEEDLVVKMIDGKDMSDAVSTLDRTALDNGKWSKSEEEIIKHCDKFIKEKAENYKKTRDYPCLSDGTSRLSPYLAIGAISAKYIMVKAKEANNKKLSSGSEGITTFVNEICWRDFYRNILVAFPRCSKNRPFKIETEKLDWNENKEDFERWCQGRTGYPIVDAAMNQLNQTGWMHNRLRMVTAMFLTKDLLLHWRLGESYFMSKLVDGDLAANNGGWQWSASTGTDAQPYFRVFNPTLQSQKFDPDGLFIKKYVPQLAKVTDKKAIHEPSKYMSAEALKKLNYPQPMCDHAASRLKAIAVFKNLSMKA